MFAAVVGYSSASLQYSQGHPRIGLVLAVATSAALILTWVRSGVSLRQAHRKDSPHELEGCLHALHSVLLATGSPDVILRLALHVPAGDDELEQITEYIGVPPKRGRIGRRFPGFGEKNQRRMVQFAETFPNSRLSQHCCDNLGWTNYSEKNLRSSET